MHEEFVKKQEMHTMVAHIVIAHMWTHQVNLGSPESGNHEFGSITAVKFE